MSPNVRLTAWVHGHVQGVGFRWWTRSRASELQLNGYASNLRDGRVEVVAEGPKDDCDNCSTCSGAAPRPVGSNWSWSGGRTPSTT